MQYLNVCVCLPLLQSHLCYKTHLLRSVSKKTQKKFVGNNMERNSDGEMNDATYVVHRRLIDTVVKLEAERSTAVVRCHELQSLVSHLSKKLKANSAQYAVSSLEHMEKFETAMIEANQAHLSERARLEDELADAHAAVISGVRAGSMPIAHDDDAFGGMAGASDADIKFTLQEDVQTVDRATSPNMLPSGFSFLGRAGRAMLDEETQTATELLSIVAKPIPAVDLLPSPPSSSSAAAPAWLANSWIRPVSVFSTHVFATNAAAHHHGQQENSPSPVNRRASVHALSARRSSTLIPEETKIIQELQQHSSTIPLSQKISQLVEDAKLKAAGQDKRRTANVPLDLTRLDAARLSVSTAQESLLAQRDAVIDDLQKQLAAARLQIDVESHRQSGVKTLSTHIGRRSVSTMTLKTAGVEAGVQSEGNMTQQGTHFEGSAVADNMPIITPLVRDSVVEDELLRVQEENIVFQRERVSLLTAHGSLLARIAELERNEYELQSKNRVASIQAHEHSESVSASVSPRRQSTLFLHDLVTTNQKLTDELSQLRSATTKQTAATHEFSNELAAMSQRNATLEQSLGSLRQRLVEHETEQQRSTQTILALQQHLRERTTELKLLRQTSEASERELTSIRTEGTTREASLYAQILQLSERLRFQSEEWQLKEYRENRNVVSVAAFQDLTEQLEAYQAQERALFEVLSRLMSREKGTEVEHQPPHTPRRSEPTKHGDLVGMVLEWSARRASASSS